MDYANETEVAEAAQLLRPLRTALQEVLFAKEELIDLLICGVLARGHILLEGLPGLGKTEFVKGLAQALELDTRRIQFTPAPPLSASGPGKPLEAKHGQSGGMGAGRGHQELFRYS